MKTSVTVDQQYHRHDPLADHHLAHLSPSAQLAGGGGCPKEAAALLAGRAQHLGEGGGGDLHLGQFERC